VIRTHPRAREVVLDTPRSPSGVVPSELADPSFKFRRDLMTAGLGAVGAVGEGCQAATFVAGDPGVDALAGPPEAASRFDHPPSILDQREHYLVALFNDTQTPPARSDLLLARRGRTRRRWLRRV